MPVQEYKKIMGRRVEAWLQKKKGTSYERYKERRKQEESAVCDAKVLADEIMEDELNIQCLWK